MNFISFFTRFNADNLGGILLCVLAGSVLTMILQSSSATVGITMALAMEGLLSFEASVALILGENIGTTITAQLASMVPKSEIQLPQSQGNTARIDFRNILVWTD